MEILVAFGQWWTFSDSFVSYDPDESAVYQFADDRGNIVYVGSTNQLQRRLKEHLSEDAKSCIKKNAKKYRVDYRSDVANEARRLYDEFVRQNGSPPLCNDKHPP
jgi:predicted GIY-YIG superfamily endonuclease